MIRLQVCVSRTLDLRVQEKGHADILQKRQRKKQSVPRTSSISEFLDFNEIAVTPPTG